MNILLLAAIQWTQVGIVVGIFMAVAVVLVTLILVTAKFCKTKSAETVEQILSQLAGANCGGCGSSSCAAFAERLASGKADLSACRVTDEKAKKQIARLLGVSAEKARPTVAVCRCNGGAHTKNDFLYTGAVSCTEQAKLYGGAKACKYGCLGCGDCVRACPEEAISLKEDCAAVNPDRCTSCGVCITVCPKDLFTRIPADAKVYVACSSHERGKSVSDICQNGCIACGKCAKVCPSSAITVRDNLAVIDYEKCIRCGECAKVCPMGTIILRD